MANVGVDSILFYRRIKHGNSKKDIKNQIENMLNNETNHVYKLALENMLAVVDMYSDNDDLINSESILDDSLYYIDNDCRSTSFYSSEVLQYEEDFDEICKSTYSNDYLQDIDDTTSLFKGVKEVLSDMYDYCMKVATYTMINRLFN